MFSRISGTGSAGSCLERTAAVPVNIDLKALLFDRLRQQVDSSTKKFGEPSLKPDQLKETNVLFAVELGCKIDVALGLSLAACDRAEQRQMADAGVAQFGGVR